jgi:hypothetical protein
MRPRHPITIAGALALVLGTPALGAVVPAAGYLVRTIPLPAAAVGGVVRRGNTLFVGQGTFGGGTEQVIRLEGATVTTIASGFNSLGGFDVDAGTLYTVDNCYAPSSFCTGTTTGDTVYAVADAGTRATPADAAASEILPAGSIPDAQDVLAVPGALLVSDATGPGAGRIVKVVGTTPTDLVTGLDFLGALATDGTTLFVANLDSSFVGAVKKFTLAGAPAGTLAGGLSGAFGVARDNAGDVLVTGGFTGDFSSSTLVAIDSGGTVTERAHGFGFSADVYFDAPRRTALVLDFGVAGVTAICRDTDADGVCDGECTAPAAIVAPKLKLDGQATPPGDDKLHFQGQLVVSGPIDPTTSGARVLVDDADGQTLVYVAVPGGAFDPGTKTGWKPNKKATAWTYANPAGLDGITKVVVKTAPATPGLVKFDVKGKHGRWPATGAASPLRAIFALDPAAGTCGLVTFAGPSPACVLDPKGKTLTCK